MEVRVLMSHPAGNHHFVHDHIKPRHKGDNDHQPDSAAFGSTIYMSLFVPEPGLPLRASCDPARQKGIALFGQQ